VTTAFVVSILKNSPVLRYLLNGGHSDLHRYGLEEAIEPLPDQGSVTAGPKTYIRGGVPSDHMNRNSRSYGAAAVAGLVAFVLGYVLVYALTISTVRESFLTGVAEAFGDEGADWKIVGWLFFNAQFVTTTVTVDLGFLGGGTDAVNFIAESDGLSTILYLIPPALLTAAGLATARLDGATETARALRLGPSVALGYLPLSVAGALLFTISVGPDSGGSPTLLTAVALAGIVYPVVFGTLGAVVGTTLAGD